MRLLLAGLLLGTACESDVDRLHRLEHARTVACDHARTEPDFLTAMQASDRCKLATRDLDAFLQKR